MKFFNHLIALLFLFAFSVPVSQASDLLAGFISVKHVSGFEYEITLTTWQNATHQNFKRCAADLIIFHDSFPQPQALINVPRVNGPDMSWIPSYCPISNPKEGETVRGLVRKNIYKTNYTFPGTGTARVLYQSIGREYNLINLQRPDLTNLIVEASLLITADGSNSTPELNADLLVPASAGNVLSFSNYVTSPDGDVQTYTLRAPSATTNYKLPSDPSYGGGSFTVNIVTGELQWNTPSLPGLYLASIKIDDIRGSSPVGYQFMDFVIEMDRTTGISEELAARIEVGPNPVRQELQIGIELLQGAEVRLDLMDLTGRVVQNLSTERVSSGAYVRNFDLDPQLASGLYLLRMQVNGQVETRKLIRMNDE